MAPFFKITCILLLLSVLSLPQSHQLAAQRKAFQKNRFGSSAFLGLNASQIAGDGHQGYDYPGLAVGLSGTAYVNWRMDFSLCLGYEERGAKPPLGFSVSQTSVPWQQNTFIKLKYAVLAGRFNLHLYPRRAALSRLTAHLTLAYGYAFDIGIRQNTDANPSNDYPPLLPLMSRNDLSWQLGFTYYFTPKLGLSLLHSLQLIPLYKTGNLPDNLVPSLRQYHFQIGFEYIIFPDRKLLERRRTPPWAY